MSRSAALHTDPGLQPERTVMSWARTLMALCVAALFFVRWYPEEGVVTFVPTLLCAVAAVAIHTSQRSRYAVQANGISTEKVRADVWAVLWMGVLVISLALTALVAVWVL